MVMSKPPGDRKREERRSASLTKRRERNKVSAKRFRDSRRDELETLRAELVLARTTIQRLLAMGPPAHHHSPSSPAPNETDSDADPDRFFRDTGLMEGCYQVGNNTEPMILFMMVDQSAHAGGIAP